VKSSDRRLGMDRPVTRRDFLQGTALGVSGALLPRQVFGSEQAAAGSSPGDPPHAYPPVLTGLRGSHPGSFEVAHALAWNEQRWEAPTDLADERYDLIVVGGGISGLASAWYYREAMGPDARILILDNHDDFGGHARRNEFPQAGPVRLAWGGSVNLEYTGYSRESLALLARLGIEPERLAHDLAFDFDSLGDLGSRLYFDADHYGRDVLAPWLSDDSLSSPEALDSWAAALPLSQDSRRSLVRFLTTRDDLLTGMSPQARADYLRHTSYQSFLIERGGMTPQAAGVFLQQSHGIWGVGTDALPVSECLALGMPGGAAVGALPPGLPTARPEAFAMFPDGNASLARLLVRALIPQVAPAGPMEDVVGARFDYARLDEPASAVRLRLDSTAVAARNLDAEQGVAVTYVRGGEACRVRAGRCVLACYNAMIPFLCPDLPAAQIEALRFPVKIPLVISNVLIAQGTAFERLKLASAYCPGRLHAHVFLVGGVSLGGYRWRWDPEAPTVVQLYGAMAAPQAGPVARDQHRAGRRRLYEMRFEDFEREIRAHLGGLLGLGGFDPARDIEAITVNRWPHGYAYERNSLSDPEWAPGQAPHELGRRRHGRIAIANSDAQGYAYVDGAIDAAWRATRELIAD
jgi:spermidine dehydrogenase